MAHVCAVLAGVTGFLYAVSFLILVVGGVAPATGVWLSSLCLLLGGLLATPALVALYHRLQQTDASFALWALLLTIAGALGSAIHGGYDLANAINPATAGVASQAPSQVDPRGLLTFGVWGIGLLIVGWLITHSPRFPKGLGYVAYLSGVLSIVLYLGRLILLTPTNPLILAPAILNGFIVNPAWYIWLGTALRREK